MFAGVYVIGGAFDLAADDAVGEAEAALQTRFPHGYREYVTTLGDGTYNERVHVLLPSTILTENTAQQEVWAENPELYEDYDNVQRSTCTPTAPASPTS